MNKQINTKVAYILKGYPRISETFILNEIHLLEMRGLTLRLFSVKQEKEKKQHTIVQQIQSVVTYAPEDTTVMNSSFWRWLKSNLPRYGKSHLALFIRRPVAYWRTFLYALFGLSLRFPFGEWPSFKRSFIKDFFRAGFIAQQVLNDREIAHLHGHFSHGSTTITMLASYMTGLPFSFTAHAKDIYLPKLNPNGLLQTKIREAQFVATCTDANRQYLEQLWPGDTPIHTIYHGLDTTFFSPRSAPKRIRMDEAPLILSVGRFVKKKGFPYLIKACSRLHERGIDFRCLIIGPPDEQSELIVQMIQEAGLSEQIQIQPGLTQEELRQTYANSDIFALACHIVENGDRDGIPNVLAEAMAMELPVVATNISGIPELVNDDENGLLIPQKDADALADALEQLLTDASLRQRLGKAARKTILDVFDSKRTTVALHQLFESQMSSHRSPVPDESDPPKEIAEPRTLAQVNR